MLKRKKIPKQQQRDPRNLDCRQFVAILKRA